ncbi:MAG: hypothetical protein ACAI44_25225 [Candidatus Sericytochromatia bacterium]
MLKKSLRKLLALILAVIVAILLLRWLAAQQPDPLVRNPVLSRSCLRLA